MHVTRPPGMPALAIVMPRPQLPHSRSSLPSSVSSPRTPRTPSCTGTTLFATSTNRNSTDSWNSSNAADDQEWDWKPEQLRLLSRTLDALPSHLVTPFNGPIPPSNLLDKIARGVSQAKGPIDWPHSLRATRVKLIELSRARAEEDQGLFYSDIEADESNDLPIYNRYPDSAGKGVKRPLYRQSSMDFMKSADLRNSDGIDCLSDRLQRPDRLISKTTFHPYPRHSRSRLSSPACSVSLITPSTPSSSTLNTLSSFSSAKRALHRTPSNLSSTSASSMSIVSSNSGAALPDPRVQRVRHSESFYAPPPPPKDIKLSPSLHKENLDSSPAAGVKRAPSFGAIAQEARRDRQFTGKDSSVYPSSDEEEKIRSKGAKKMRVKDFGGLAPAVSLSTGTAPSAPSLTKKTKKTSCEDCKSPQSLTPTNSKRNLSRKANARDEADAKPTVPAELASAKEQRRKHPRMTPMNVQRNPSIFGAELPHLRSPPPSSPQTLSSPLSPSRSLLQPSPCLPDPSPAPGSPVLATPHQPKVKTLRRVQRLTLGRRISFGSLVAPGDDADGEDDFEDRGLRRQRELGQLGSAFQLQC